MSTHTDAMYNLCCIANELKPDHRIMSMTWQNYNAGRRLVELADRWLNNVRTTLRTIEHCHRNGWGYRISSSLFPVLTHPEFGLSIEDAPNWAQIDSVFEQIRIANSVLGVRLSMHPDQFNVLASDNEQAVDRTINELNMHGWVMDKLGCTRSHQNPINIHINCSKGEPGTVAERFVRNLFRCDDSVISRLVVENEDRGMWNTESLLNHIAPFGIPITFDNLHHACNPSVEEDAAMDGCAGTWGAIRPIFHYSESEPGHTNPRSHAAVPTNRPREYGCDWDIELKDKERAIRMLA